MKSGWHYLQTTKDDYAEAFRGNGGGNITADLKGSEATISSEKSTKKPASDGS